MNVRLTPSEVRGTVTAPPSKSMAHRAILCAALAPGAAVWTISPFRRISSPR